MARQKTGRPVGRQPRYDDAQERPVTVSLRIPRELATEMKVYASRHRQSVTELLLDGLKWRLREGDPRGGGMTMSQPLGEEYYSNTAIYSAALPDNDARVILAKIFTALASQDHQLDAVIKALQSHPGLSVPDVHYGNTIKEPPGQQGTTVPVLDGKSISTPPETPQKSNTVIQDNAPDAMQPLWTIGSDACPWYDDSKYALKPLCKRKHEWGYTGQSLKTKNNTCTVCREEHRLAKRQATAAGA